jgi:hypothetical protein
MGGDTPSTALYELRLKPQSTSRTARTIQSGIELLNSDPAQSRHRLDPASTPRSRFYQLRPGHNQFFEQAFSHFFARGVGWLPYFESS